MPSARTRWILCDRASRWARAIRSTIRFDRGIGKANGQLLEKRLLEVTSHEACLSALQDDPASFVTLGVDEGDFATCLEFSAAVVRQFSLAQVAIVSTCNDRAAEWHCRSLAFREAGAGMVLGSIWQLPALSQRALRHLTAAPTAEPPIIQRVWNSLPWDDS